MIITMSQLLASAIEASEEARRAFEIERAAWLAFDEAAQAIRPSRLSVGKQRRPVDEERLARIAKIKNDGGGAEEIAAAEGVGLRHAFRLLKLVS